LSDENETKKREIVNSKKKAKNKNKK